MLKLLKLLSLLAIAGLVSTFQLKKLTRGYLLNWLQQHFPGDKTRIEFSSFQFSWRSKNIVLIDLKIGLAATDGQFVNVVVPHLQIGFSAENRQLRFQTIDLSSPTLRYSSLAALKRSLIFGRSDKTASILPSDFLNIKRIKLVDAKLWQSEQDQPTTIQTFSTSRQPALAQWTVECLFTHLGQTNTYAGDVELKQNEIAIHGNVALNNPSLTAASCDIAAEYVEAEISILIEQQSSKARLDFQLTNIVCNISDYRLGIDSCQLQVSTDALSTNLNHIVSITKIRFTDINLNQLAITFKGHEQSLLFADEVFISSAKQQDVTPEICFGEITVKHARSHIHLLKNGKLDFGDRQNSLITVMLDENNVTSWSTKIITFENLQITLTSPALKYAEHKIIDLFKLRLRQFQSSPSDVRCTFSGSGLIGEFGELSFSGHHANDKPQVTIEVVGTAKNLSAEDLSFLSERYIGVEILRGQLSLNFSFSSEGADYRMENDLTLNQLKVRARSLSPVSTGLEASLGMMNSDAAMDFFRDSHRSINLTLPLKGSINQSNSQTKAMLANALATAFEASLKTRMRQGMVDSSDMAFKMATQPFTAFLQAADASLNQLQTTQRHSLKFDPLSVSLSLNQQNTLLKIGREANRLQTTRIFLAGFSSTDDLHSLAGQNGHLREPNTKLEKTMLYKLAQARQVYVKQLLIDRLSIDKGRIFTSLPRVHSDQYFDHNQSACTTLSYKPPPI